MSQERIDAAQRVMAEVGEWTGSDEQMCNLLAATDAVLFSDEAIDRAVQAVAKANLDWAIPSNDALNQYVVHAVVGSLAGDQASRSGQPASL